MRLASLPRFVVLGGGLLAFAAGCAPAAAPRATRAPGASAVFERQEDEVLHDLAAVDRRIAQRARLTPTDDDLRRVAMAAVLREDPTVVVIDGAIDPLSFDARARGLESAAQKIAALATDGQATERELLARLVQEERLRLEEERALPRSSSALVRAIVDTWRAPQGEREAADCDRWLARRLEELRESLDGHPGDLDVVRARELDDALDALEHLISIPGFTRATQSLVRLREALETAAAKPAATAHSDWSSLAPRARAHLGVDAAPAEIARGLERVLDDLRARALQAMNVAGVGTDTIAEALEPQVFTPGPCLDAVPGSRVRSMAAPPEREPSCHLRQLAGTASDAKSNALALAAMHDHVVVALWALEVASGTATIAQAEGRHRLLVPITPDTRARYERIALARPLAAIGAGETARLLLRRDPAATAQAWARIGDVPLDVARRELGL